jgi:hypothetical protein
MNRSNRHKIRPEKIPMIKPAMTPVGQYAPLHTHEIAYTGHSIECLLFSRILTFKWFNRHTWILVTRFSLSSSGNLLLRSPWFAFFTYEVTSISYLLKNHKSKLQSQFFALAQYFPVHSAENIELPNVTSLESIFDRY